MGHGTPWQAATMPCLFLEKLVCDLLRASPSPARSGAAAVPLGPPPLAKFSSWREKYRAYLSQA